MDSDFQSNAFGPLNGRGEATFGLTGSGATYQGATIDAAFNAAIKAIGAGNADLKCVPGSYTLANFMNFYNVSNVRVDFTGSVLTLPNGATWRVAVSGASNRCPIMLVSHITNCAVVGGTWNQTGTVTGHIGTGLLIGDTVSNFDYWNINFTNIERFAVLSTGYDGNSSTGGWNGIRGHNCTGTGLGTAGTDGGYLRISNNGTGTCSGHMEEHPTATTNQYGMDVGGSSSGQIGDIVLIDPQFTASGTCNSPLINYEDAPTVPYLGPITVIGGYCVGGGFSALGQAYNGDGWCNTTMIGTQLVGSLVDGIHVKVGTIAKFNNRYVDVTVKNAGQTNGHGAGTDAGLLVTEAGTASATFQGFSIIGGFYGDDQATTTQKYGIVLNRGSAGSTWSNITIEEPVFYANVTAPFLFSATAGSSGVVGLSYRSASGGAVGLISSTAFGVIAPFTIGLMGRVASTAASFPATGSDFTCTGTPVVITSTGGTGVTLTLKDQAGNVVANLGATTTLTRIPVGWKLNVVYTTKPTINVWAEGGD